MWRYVPAVASAFAIINGLIAIAVAQLGLSQEAKVALLIGAAIIGALAIAATFYGQHAIEKTRKAEIAETRKKREALADFLVRGEGLMALCREGHPEEASTKWLGEIMAFLLENFDSSYVTRLNNPAGIASVHFHGIPAGERQNLCAGINTRIVRLHEFIAAMS